MKRLICAVIVLGFVAAPVVSASADERDILKQGVVGAATGAIVAKESDGKAGKGALIGVGTTVVGGALMDVIMPAQKTTTTTTTQQYPQQQPVQQQPVYAPQPQQVVYVPQPPQQAPTTDAQSWYQKGYQDGFKAGYQEGMNAQKPR